MDIKVNSKELMDKVQEWAENHLSPSFSFRPYQKETIVNILQNFFGETKTQVMEAPTGSGKSLIAIISAGVLWEYYQKKSYILVSDLGLFEQYEKDLKKYKLDWGLMKGKDNYICVKNQNTISNSHCSIQQVGWAQISDEQVACSKGYSCALHCKYVVDKKKAIAAPVTIMTYQYWFIQRNYVEDDLLGTEALFKEREFTICDEAHKLPDLVQSHFSPRVENGNLSHFQLVYNYAQEHHYQCPPVEHISRTAAVLGSLPDSNKDDIFACVLRLEHKMNEFRKVYNSMREDAKAMSLSERASLYKQFAAGNLIRQQHCKFDDYARLIKELGTSTIVSTWNESLASLTLCCAFEHKMVQKYFHEKTDRELLMSATIGDVDIYREMIGSKEQVSFEAFEVPSTFDFSKSPIYWQSNNRMGFREKSVSLPNVIKQIIDICQKHHDQKGIIQTGSYEFSKALWDALPPNIKSRVIFYNDSKGKLGAIARYKSGFNKILIGPSLVEGLNFPDDMCRFCICMKLPYASLSDKLVVAKLNLIKDWYQSDVCNKLEQSFGRGVRHEKDWCVTYILDGCFADIVNRNLSFLKPSTQSRLQKIEA